jgi:hypothetical protein
MGNYIRTQNAIYNINDLIEKTSKEYVYNAINSGFKKSDTIEELCEEFVMVNNSCFTTPQIIDFIQLDMYKGEDIYGAIWTDKGLIYVAKMNQEGKLELLRGY